MVEFVIVGNTDLVAGCHGVDFVMGLLVILILLQGFMMLILS